MMIIRDVECVECKEILARECTLRQLDIIVATHMRELHNF